jgi:hypothetical protein
MHREDLADDLIASLAKRTDDHGWLSIYVDASPQRQTTSPPEWVMPVRRRLSEVREQVKEEGPRERWRAVDERIDDLDDALAELLDPRTSGRGRALFVPISGDDEILVMAQVPFTDLVRLGDAPVVGPLVVALDRHRPVGVAAVHRQGLYVAEHRLGEIEEVSGASFWIDTEDWREMKGPAGANPALPQQSSSQTDKFDRRVDEHIARRLREMAGAVQSAAAERAWDSMFLVGDPRLTAVLRSEVAPEGREGGPRVVEVEKISPEPDPIELGELVASELHRTEAQRQLELVDRALGATSAGDGGAKGRQKVLEAFQAGRVERVVVPEDALTDELIHSALDTSAAVTVVEGEAAAKLSDNGGVAALLRW